jgi:NtrC-family two-component system sensor histidine kinase KinB
MRIKTKLHLGFGFLFVVVLLFGGVSLYYMNRISVNSKLILKDNYKSLNFTGKMRTILEDYTIPLSNKAVEKFKTQLDFEKNNLTEKGEQQAVAILETAFDKLTNRKISLEDQQAAVKIIRQQLRFIDALNMKAIVGKNDAAQHGVEEAATFLIFAATVCFLILFSFVISFPSYVANPLREFSEAIKGISKQNYKQRLEFNGTDEFSELALEFNTMAAHLNKWEDSNLAKIQSEKLRIEAIIEQMDNAIIGLNEKQDILFLNKVAGQLLNLNQNEAIGRNALELMKKNDLLNRILQTNNGDQPLKIYADQKDSYFQLERKAVMVPSFDQEELTLTETGKQAGEVYILRNITPFKELDEAKTNFIATVSHELKTPISSIKMSLKLLDDERVGIMNPEQKEMVQHIKEDCGRLLKITSELLDLAQVETGNLQLTFTKTNPSTIAVYAIDSVRFQAEQKEIALELISDDDLPMVNVDTEKTAWVLVNFLSNAMRYSAAKSKVLIRITGLTNEIEFSVKDYGKGIDEQYQERLFDRYFQVPTDGNNKSGSGLGLAISKDFIEAEGGRIWVESAIGEGSRFCFVLPIAI